MKSPGGQARSLISSRARLPADTLASLRPMERGGEYGELTVELAAALAKTGALVSSALGNQSFPPCWKPPECRPIQSTS